jgi:hypothetical protein
MRGGTADIVPVGWNCRVQRPFAALTSIIFRATQRNAVPRVRAPPSLPGLTRQPIPLDDSLLFDGCPQNSGLPEFCIVKRRKSGKPDLRCQSRA